MGRRVICDVRAVEGQEVSFHERIKEICSGRKRVCTIANCKHMIEPLFYVGTVAYKHAGYIKDATRLNELLPASKSWRTSLSHPLRSNCEPKCS